MGWANAAAQCTDGIKSVLRNNIGGETRRQKSFSERTAAVSKHQLPVKLFVVFQTKSQSKNPSPFIIFGKHFSMRATRVLDCLGCEMKMI